MRHGALLPPTGQMDGGKGKNGDTWTLSQIGRGPGVTRMPAHAPVSHTWNIRSTCYATTDIPLCMITNPPTLLIFSIKGPGVVPGARGARPRGGRYAGQRAAPARTRLALPVGLSARSRPSLLLGRKILVPIGEVDQIRPEAHRHEDGLVSPTICRRITPGGAFHTADNDHIDQCLVPSADVYIPMR